MELSRARELADRAQRFIGQISQLPEGNLDPDIRGQIFDALGGLSKELQSAPSLAISARRIDTMRIQTKDDAMKFCEQCSDLIQSMPGVLHGMWNKLHPRAQKYLQPLLQQPGVAIPFNDHAMLTYDDMPDESLEMKMQNLRHIRLPMHMAEFGFIKRTEIGFMWMPK